MTCEGSGKIEDIPVRTLLKWIRHSSRTGILVLDETDASGAIEFLDGEIVSARTGAGFTDIGTILLENKVINAELLKSAVLTLRLIRFCKIAQPTMRTATIPSTANFLSLIDLSYYFHQCPKNQESLA